VLPQLARVRRLIFFPGLDNVLESFRSFVPHKRTGIFVVTGNYSPTEIPSAGAGGMNTLRQTLLAQDAEEHSAKLTHDACVGVQRKRTRGCRCGQRCAAWFLWMLRLSRTIVQTVARGRL